jgi:DNA-binding FrmR family transcriptional regulator
MKNLAQAATHREQVVRLKRIEGQIRGIQRMIEDERYCIDILHQLQAIQAAVRVVEANILKKHLQECVGDAVRSGSEREQDAKLDEIVKLLFQLKG